MASLLPHKAKASSFETAREPVLHQEQNAPTSWNWAGIAAVCAGMMLHIVLGTLYCWGNFNSYTPAHMKNFDGSFDPAQSSTADTLQVMPLTLSFQALSMPVGTLLHARYGPVLSSLLSSVLVSAGLILASFTSSLGLFTLCYAGVFGCGIGIGYTQPLVTGFKHFPNSKGTISGLILGAFGLGGFIFNNIGTAIFNPTSLSIDPSSKLFPASVTGAFASNLRILGCIYFLVMAASSPMIRPPKTSDSIAATAAANAPGYSIPQALQTHNFWLMWLAIVLCAQGGLYVGAMYKVIAQEVPALANDRYLSMVGALGALSNGLMRPVWGFLYDRLGYRSCFSIIACLQAVVIFVFPKIESAAMHVPAVILSWAALAGNFAMAPAEIAKIFGNPAVFPCMFTAFAFSGVFGVKISKFVAYMTNSEAVFLYLAATAIAALFLVQLHRPPPPLA